MSESLVAWRNAAQGWMEQTEREVALRESVAAENERLRQVIRNERDPEYLGSLAFQLREALRHD